MSLKKDQYNITKQRKYDDSKQYSKDIFIKVADFLGNINLEDESVVYAMDGHMFECLMLLKDSDNVDTFVVESIQKLFNGKCQIYARMTPEMKAQLVRELQASKNIVLMCGDGANDCAALKVADVGVSLSLEDASIAAPFTSTISNISTIKKVLREGKGSLVTSFQCFKFMILYSMIVLISGAILLGCKTYLTDWEFLIVDAALIFPFATLIGLTGSYKPLNKAIPTTSLISISVLTSILAQITASTICMFLALIILKEQEWYKEYKPQINNKPMNEVEASFENTVSINT